MNGFLERKIAVFSLLFFLLLFRIAALLTYNIPLYGDEAQYWLWSERLDFGYFSKPPGVAFLIKCTTSIFGDNEWAIRLSSPILHFFTSWLIYRIGKRLFDQRTGLLSAVIYSFMPAIFLSSNLISTDPPLLFLWSASMLMLIKALEKDRLKDWIALGAICGLGMLTKYNMVLFGLSAFILLLSSKYDRAVLRGYKIYLCAIIALLIWLPNLIWNYQHGFISFIHTADLAGAKDGMTLKFDALGKFLSEQFLLFGPFSLLAFIIYTIKKLSSAHKLKLEERFLFIFAFTFLIVISCFALKSRAHGNWAAPAYISISILTARYLLDKKWVVVLGAILHSAVIMLALNYEFTLSIFDQKLTYQNDIMRRIRPNAELGQKLSELAKKYPNAVLATDDRLFLASMIYYTQPRIYNIQKFTINHPAEDYFDMISDHSTFKNHDVIVIGTHDTPYSVKLAGHKASKIAELGYSRYKILKPYNVIMLKKE